MTDTIALLSLETLSVQDRTRLLERTESALEPFLDKVKPIIAAVRAEGDAALVRFARLFDQASLTVETLKVSEAEFDAACDSLGADIKAAIDYAAANVLNFHERQRPEPMWLHEVQPGAFAGERTTPIGSVACYVPRGKGSFPSTVIMTAIPARVAGVPELLIVTPPGPDGTVDAATLYAARAAGVADVYKCGGAQAIAAVAFGTATLPKCHKVVGPGSPWVVAAKRLCADVIDTGTPAGPSESIIFADGTLDGRLAALDLLIEAEHGADSSAWLVTTDKAVAEAARAEIPKLWAQMTPERVDYTRTVLSGTRGGILLCPDTASAMAFINDYAPEHLQILSSDPFGFLALVQNAGEILLGGHTPSTLGNFVLGPSHVLPTGGWAKSCSALSVHDFMKRTSLAYVTGAAYGNLAHHAHIFASHEGFPAHANAVSARRKDYL